MLQRLAPLLVFLIVPLTASAQEPCYDHKPLSVWIKKAASESEEERKAGFLAIHAIADYHGSGAIKAAVPVIMKEFARDQKEMLYEAARAFSKSGGAGLKGYVETLTARLGDEKSPKEIATNKKLGLLGAVLKEFLSKPPRPDRSSFEVASALLKHEHWVGRLLGLRVLKQDRGGLYLRRHYESIKALIKDPVGAVASEARNVELKARGSLTPELTARRHGNEAAAIGSLRVLVSAQSIYRERNEALEYGSLADLKAKNYIDKVLASGVKSGYRFTVKLGDALGKDKSFLFKIYASPVKPGITGSRWFFVDQSGVVRYSETGPANEDSKAIGGR